MNYNSCDDIDGNCLKSPTDKTRLLVPCWGFIHILYFKDQTRPWNIQSALLQPMQLSIQLQK